MVSPTVMAASSDAVAKTFNLKKALVQLTIMGN